MSSLLTIAERGNEIIFFRLLLKERYNIRHEVDVYHPSENEYISLSDEYLINFAEIAYHQNEVLYIIKSQRNTPSVMIYTLKRDDIRMYISPQASYTFNDIPSLRLG